MYKNILFIIFILSGIFLFSNKSFSTCCPDSTQQDTLITKQIEFDGDSCDVDILFCHKITPLGIREIYICAVYIDSTCGWDSVDISGYIFWEEIYGAILDYSNDILPFPPCSSVNQTAVNVEIRKAECWYIYNDPIEMVSKLEPCSGDAGQCRIDYNACWENGELKKTVISTTLEESGDCYVEDDEIIFDPLNPFPDCFETCY